MLHTYIYILFLLLTHCKCRFSLIPLLIFLHSLSHLFKYFRFFGALNLRYLLAKNFPLSGFHVFAKRRTWRVPIARKYYVLSNVCTPYALHYIAYGARQKKRVWKRWEKRKFLLTITYVGWKKEGRVKTLNNFVREWERKRILIKLVCFRASSFNNAVFWYIFETKMAQIVSKLPL